MEIFRGHGLLAFPNKGGEKSDFNFHSECNGMILNYFRAVSLFFGNRISFDGKSFDEIEVSAFLMQIVESFQFSTT